METGGKRGYKKGQRNALGLGQTKGVCQLEKKTNQTEMKENSARKGGGLLTQGVGTSNTGVEKLMLGATYGPREDTNGVLLG